MTQTHTQTYSAFTTGRYQSAQRQGLKNWTVDDCRKVAIQVIFKCGFLFCSCKQACICECSTNSWSNSTWQESLPPSWYPAQIMSYKMSTCSVGSVRYISWHELWEMIGTCTSCRVPTPDRGTEGNTRTDGGWRTKGPWDITSSVYSVFFVMFLQKFHCCLI